VLDKKDLFYCYSGKLKQFLCNKGFRFLHKGLNDSTNKQFWVFIKDEKLNEARTQWSKREN